MTLTLHGTARTPRGERLLDERTIRMPVGEQSLQRAPNRIAGERRLHRRIAEEQLTRRVEQSDRVLEMFNSGLQIGLLAGEERPVRGELLADGVEEVAKLAELVTRRQIEPNADLSFPESGQAAAQDVNR